VAGILRYQRPAASARSVNQGPESGAGPADGECVVAVGAGVGAEVGAVAAVAAVSGAGAVERTPFGSSPLRKCQTWRPVQVAWHSCLAGSLGKAVMERVEWGDSTLGMACPGVVLTAARSSSQGSGHPFRHSSLAEDVLAGA
jgi:hypothetical protein